MHAASFVGQYFAFGNQKNSLPCGAVLPLFTDVFKYGWLLTVDAEAMDKS